VSVKKKILKTTYLIFLSLITFYIVFCVLFTLFSLYFHVKHIFITFL